MPKPRVNSSQRFKFQFSFLCFYRNDEGNTNRRNYFLQWLFLMAVMIFLQYSYNTSYNCGNTKISEVESKTTESSEGAKFILNRTYHYHQRILSYDRFIAMNLGLINLGEKELPEYKENTPVCRLNKSSLGPIMVNKTRVSLESVEMMTPNVRAGGFYAPKKCRSRHKVAVLVPYRNRIANLAIFLYYVHQLMQKQLLQYRIFVIEQYGNAEFNKGALYNVAYLETQRFGRWHCLIFHDVDLIPQDERILYSCPRKPTHMSPAVESMSYKLWYAQLFGGVTAMTPQQFLKVNGYSNYYWNWGAEDDDMFIRLQASRLPVLRYNASIARYATLPHKKATINEKRYKALNWAKRRFRYEGLKTLEYKVIEIAKKKLFTHILVDVNPFNYPVE